MTKSFFLTRVPTVIVAVAIGVAACSDERSTTGPSLRAAIPVRLEISSRTVETGERLAVAVRVDETIGGLQGSLRFDASRLKYIGQVPDVKSITMVNASNANEGALRFGSFHPSGIKDRVAQFVFEVRGGGYADGLAYVHEAAASTGAQASRLAVNVHQAAMVNRAFNVSGDARRMAMADWAAMLDNGAERAPIAARPGEYRLNLRYGDVNFDNVIDLFDYLDVANAAVGNDHIIVGTDNPAADKDLVVAGNVAPSGASCGLEADGSRILDLFDYLAVANEAVGTNELCVGDVIPGRGPLPSTVQSVSAASIPDLIIGNGEVVTFTNDRIWQLEGVLRVQDGGVLNVQAGTKVQGNTAASETPAIFVERGGRINATGTLEQPILFTCTAEPKAKGCWGGIFVAGRSSVNVDDPTAPRYAGAMTCDADVANNARIGEGGAPPYGGCVRGDNSGTIRYAIIEYGGKILSADSELNGLTLSGVGSGTTVEYVQIHGGTDDGIEFFGGSVNVKYLVLTGNDDDQFDISFGWNGDAQFVIAQADDGGVGSTGSPDSKAIEADNSEPSSLATPRTSPRLFNFTLIGNLATTQPAAIHLRRGTGPSLNNSLVIGYPRGLDIDDAVTCDNAVASAPAIKSTTFIDVPDLGNSDSGDPVGTGVCPAGSSTEMEEAFLTAQPGFRTRTGIADVLVDALNTDLPDWRMKLVGGLPAEGGVEAIPAGSIFSAANYRGAVAPVGSGGSIPWYSGWTRPWQAPTEP